jgi:hypothetical protein
VFRSNEPRKPFLLGAQTPGLLRPREEEVITIES